MPAAVGCRSRSPMTAWSGKLIGFYVTVREGAPVQMPVTVPKDIMSTGRWTKEQLKLAFHLYCQIPFGKLHYRNPEIAELAELIGRTPSAVAMKLVNFASLDPAITGSGRKGLGNASSADREVWDEFHADWEGLALECSRLREAVRPGQGTVSVSADSDIASGGMADFTGETRQVMTEQRIKQDFFRRAVLSSYRGRCCMSNLSEPRLLIASHIVPWSKDRANRLNPSNGLCLSAIHDKAFDLGLLTLSDDLRIMVSDELKRRDEAFLNQIIVPLDGRLIEMPERFTPDLTLVRRHRSDVFVDSQRR